MKHLKILKISEKNKFLVFGGHFGPSTHRSTALSKWGRSGPSAPRSVALSMWGRSGPSAPRSIAKSSWGRSGPSAPRSFALYGISLLTTLIHVSVRGGITHMDPKSEFFLENLNFLGGQKKR